MKVEKINKQTFLNLAIDEQDKFWLMQEAEKENRSLSNYVRIKLLKDKPIK